MGRSESVPLTEVRDAASGARRLFMVILDACWNNQFPALARSGTRGMAPVNERPGEIVLYSIHCSMAKLRFRRDSAGAEGS